MELDPHSLPLLTLAGERAAQISQGRKTAVMTLEMEEHRKYWAVTILYGLTASGWERQEIDIQYTHQEGGANLFIWRGRI